MHRVRVVDSFTSYVPITRNFVLCAMHMALDSVCILMAVCSLYCDLATLTVNDLMMVGVVVFILVITLTGAVVIAISATALAGILAGFVYLSTVLAILVVAIHQVSHLSIKLWAVYVAYSWLVVRFRTTRAIEYIRTALTETLVHASVAKQKHFLVITKLSRQRYFPPRSHFSALISEYPLAFNN